MTSFAIATLNDLGRFSSVIDRMPSFGRPIVDERARHRRHIRGADQDSLDINAWAGR